MKLFTSLLSLLFCCTCCFGQAFNYNQGSTAAKNYYQQIPYESINGEMFITVELAGKKHKFLFDTGNFVSISKELAAELNATMVDKTMLIDANGTVDSTSIVMVNALKLGDVVFNQVPAIMLFPDVYKCWNIDGVIGSNLLTHLILSIDKNKHVIILTDQVDKLALNPDHSTSLATDTNNQCTPIIRVALRDKVALLLEFDTGDASFMRMSEELMDGLTNLDVYSVIDKGYGSGEYSAFGWQKNDTKYLLKIPFLTVGNGRFDNLIVATSKGSIPAIGNKLLDYGRVTLDYIHHKFYFDANHDTANLYEKQWPFDPIPLNNKLTVGVVWGKAANKLKPGDQIMAIDDLPYPTYTLCNLANDKPVLEGKDTVVITVKDEQGKIKKMKISKE